MNFAGSQFLLLFLPITLVGFYCIHGPEANRLRRQWLTAASVVFYGASGLSNLALLAASMSVNYAAGWTLSRNRIVKSRYRKLVMWASVVASITLLASFKVFGLSGRSDEGFLVGTELLLPLGLSFITFQQIGFVISCYKRQTRPSLEEYVFFLLFFPQLIMGPIVQYQDISPQLRRGVLSSSNRADVVIGMSIFIFGLSKKLLLADPIGGPVTAIFDNSSDGVAISSLDAWFAMVGFNFQLYLDFSAYADMAIGLGRMFGVALPINFDAPFHAVDRFDRWRRWHITFVTFMRTHVFMPLMRYWHFPGWAALFTTVLLSALWHGLGWTFVIWGIAEALVMLAVHLRKGSSRPLAGAALAWAIARAFMVTSLLGVLFRAPTIESAERIYTSLIGFDGFGSFIVTPWDGVRFFAAAASVWILPDAKRLFERYWTAFDPRPTSGRSHTSELLPGKIRFRPTPAWGVLTALLLVWGLLQSNQAARFVYVQF